MLSWKGQLACDYGWFVDGGVLLCVGCGWSVSCSWVVVDGLYLGVLYVVGSVLCVGSS